MIQFTSQNNYRQFQNGPLYIRWMYKIKKKVVWSSCTNFDPTKQNIIKKHYVQKVRKFRLRNENFYVHDKRDSIINI